MSEKHTPGPWEVHEIDDGPIGYNAVISRGVRSTVTGKGINTGDDYEMFSAADARLIAAAPDYWDAAEQMTTDSTELEGDDAGYVAVPKEAYDALMAAHAKSEGKQP